MPAGQRTQSLPGSVWEGLGTLADVIEQGESEGGVRPKFELELDGDAEAVLGRLQAHLDRTDFGCAGWVAPPYAELEVRPALKRTWSPRLAVYGENADRGCVLRCRFQPEPGVWTLYMAATAVLSVGAACCIAWACACMIMGQGLVAPLVGLSTAFALGGLLYFVAISGQRLGADQMQSLREELEVALRTDTDDEREPRLQRFGASASG